MNNMHSKTTHAIDIATKRISCNNLVTVSILLSLFRAFIYTLESIQMFVLENYLFIFIVMTKTVIAKGEQHFIYSSA